uniref:C2H2-type domain-containing protein n=1 Tax=viral metagenome TaxID=1070528 RepID=A0A6C0IND6_9ZZZZ
MEAKKTQKTPKIFECIVCNFISCNKKDYHRHLLTAKHTKEANGSTKKPLTYMCEFCNKCYRSRGSFWKHQKNCSGIPDNTHTDIYNSTADSNKLTPNTDIVQTMLHLIKQNQDFKELIIEQNKQLIELTNKPTTTNNTTNNNQKFNLNFFLNTTCKDAMNMTDFIENMDVQIEDIENIGRNGYVVGMTDMILSRIKNLEVTKRPMHCTDLKRETIYIKDNNAWEKDDNNAKLHKMIGCIAQQNYSIIPAWRDKHPDCMNSETPKFEFCITMMRNVLGDAGEDQTRLDNKVIRNITKHVNVDKTTTIVDF